MESLLEREIHEWQLLYPDREVNLGSPPTYSCRNDYLGLQVSDDTLANDSKTIIFARIAIQQLFIEQTPSPTPNLYRNFNERLGPWNVVLTFSCDTLLEQALDELSKPYAFLPEWRLDRGQDMIALEERYID